MEQNINIEMNFRPWDIYRSLMQIVVPCENVHQLTDFACPRSPNTAFVSLLHCQMNTNWQLTAR